MGSNSALAFPEKLRVLCTRTPLINNYVSIELECLYTTTIWVILAIVARDVWCQRTKHLIAHY